jgi:hypothetical protein
MAGIAGAQKEAICIPDAGNDHDAQRAKYSAIRRWGGTSAVLRSVVNGGYCLGSVSA